jgi:hypothetical protein
MTEIENLYQNHYLYRCNQKCLGNLNISDYNMLIMLMQVSALLIPLGGMSLSPLGMLATLWPYGPVPDDE